MKRACWYKTIVPWCGFLCLLAYEGHRLSKWIVMKARIKAELALVPHMAEDVKSAEYLYDGKVFKAVAFTCYPEEEERETIFLTVRDKVGILLSRTVAGFLSSEEERGRPRFHLTVLSDIRSARSFLSCGSSPTGEFPGYLIVYPQTGPEAGGYVFYGDYDLDGQFEKRLDMKPKPPVAPKQELSP